MNRNVAQQVFVIGDLAGGSALIRVVQDKGRPLKDPIAERLRQTVLRLMGEMEQEELARLATEPLHRVQKFINGQLIKPPLSFLDHVLHALGSSLREALEKDPPIRPLPISRADVREVAQLLQRHSRGYVEGLKVQLTELALEQSRGRVGAKRRGRG